MRKPIHYIRHFDLQGRHRSADTTAFDRADEFVFMMNQDLEELANRHNFAAMDIQQRDVVLRSIEKDMRNKFRGIVNKTLGVLPESLWTVFHKKHMNYLFYRWEVKKSDNTSSRYLTRKEDGKSINPTQSRPKRRSTSSVSNKK